MMARYGFTPDQIAGLSYSDYGQIKKAAEANKKEEARDDLVTASFTAWQVLAALGNKSDFNKYIKELGLIEGEKKSPQQRAAEKAAALKSAANIADLDKKRSEKERRE